VSHSEKGTDGATFLIGLSILVADLSFLSLLAPPAETGMEAGTEDGTVVRADLKFSLFGDILPLFPDCFGSLKLVTEMFFSFA
jgi:hypothetical protein